MSLSPNHQTNKQAPSEYLSIRLTTSHDEWPRILSSVLHDVYTYVAYPHTGKTAENPHWHILIVPDHIRDGERLRHRIKSTFGGGNKSFSFKKLTNGLLAGIQYCSRESTRPMVAGPDMQHWIDLAPAWETDKSKLVSKPSKERLADPSLTLTNVVKQAVKYARQHSLTCNLTEVLFRMASDDWVPSRDLLKNGLPRPIHDEFAYRMTLRERKPHLWMYPTDPTEDQIRWRERPDDRYVIVPPPPATTSNTTMTHEKIRDESGVFKAPWQIE